MPKSANYERFTNCGWASTRFHGRSAWRGPNGWVAYRHEGEWKLFRDSHGSTAYFASYQTVSALLKDSGLAFSADRVRHEIRETKSTVPEYGTWTRPLAQTWAPDDPRWG